MVQDQKHNVLCPERVLERAKEIFGDEQTALQWLRTPSRRFQGCTPMEMSITEEGALKVEELLTQIDEGMFA